MAYDVSYLKSTIDKLDTNTASGIRYFNMRNRTQTTIRIIPITDAKPIWLVAYHYNIDNTIVSKVLCPARTAMLNNEPGGSCPICEHALEVPAAERRQWMPKDRVIFYVIDAADVQAGVKVMDLSIYVARDLVSLIVEDPDKYLSLDKGHPIKVVKVAASKGGYYYNYIPIDDKVVDLTRTVRITVDNQMVDVNLAELIEKTKPDPNILFAMPTEAELNAFLTGSFKQAAQAEAPNNNNTKDAQPATPLANPPRVPPEDDMRKLQNILGDFTDVFGG